MSACASVPGQKKKATEPAASGRACGGKDLAIMSACASVPGQKKKATEPAASGRVFDDIKAIGD